MLNFLRKIRTRNYVILALLIATFLCSEMCTTPHPADANGPIHDNYGNAFAGSVACMSCHKDIYNSNIHTAHYLDSRPALKEYIKGSFDSSNRVVYGDGTAIVMEHKNNGFFQTAMRNGKEVRSEAFGIVIGSGKKGQTYLYWDDGKLFQLPASYSVLSKSWCNSPGFSVDTPRFDRQIPAYCLECHGTYARTEFRNSTDPGDFYLQNQIIYGIDCERCHGPGAEHVSYHTAHPGERTGKFIINARLLSRQQRLDACALCHSGIRSPRMPAFSFRVGDTLNNYSDANFRPDNKAALDVHGNQYGLLSSSKCFMNSQMDCGSCHNPHANEAGNAKLYSQRCMTCHNEPAHNTCTMPATPGLVLSDNCIDCHMPDLATKKIVLTLAHPTDPSQAVFTLIRTHHIAIYTQQTKEFLEKLKARRTASPS